MSYDAGSHTCSSVSHASRTTALRKLSEGVFVQFKALVAGPSASPCRQGPIGVRVPCHVKWVDRVSRCTATGLSRRVPRCCAEQRNPSAPAAPSSARRDWEGCLPTSRLRIREAEAASGHATADRRRPGADAESTANALYRRFRFLWECSSVRVVDSGLRSSPRPSARSRRRRLP
jgi:hypothetical protein